MILSGQLGIAVLLQCVRKVSSAVTCSAATPAPPAFEWKWQEPSNCQKDRAARGQVKRQDRVLLEFLCTVELNMHLLAILTHCRADLYSASLGELITGI